MSVSGVKCSRLQAECVEQGGYIWWVGKFL